jgi:hypothetical protein
MRASAAVGKDGQGRRKVEGLVVRLDRGSSNLPGRISFCSAGIMRVPRTAPRAIGKEAADPGPVKQLPRRWREGTEKGRPMVVLACERLGTVVRVDPRARRDGPGRPREATTCPPTSPPCRMTCRTLPPPRARPLCRACPPAVTVRGRHHQFRHRGSRGGTSCLRRTGAKARPTALRVARSRPSVTLGTVMRSGPSSTREWLRDWPLRPPLARSDGAALPEVCD